MKVRHITVVFMALSALLNGCAATSPREAQDKMAQFRQTIPICEGEADCKAKWEAAQLWVVHNSGYKIQTVTDVVIETYNPAQYDTLLAARVTKEPLGAGKYQIIINTWCNNIFGCVRNPLEAALDFNRTVSDTTP